WFARHRRDVVVVSQAEPVCGWLAAQGVVIPRDVGLVELRCYEPAAGHAGVYYDPANTGALAVEMLIGLMHRQERGVPVLPHEVLIQGGWNEGTTLGTPPPRKNR